MKNLLVLLVLFIGLSSCNKEANVDSDSFFKCKIDGKEFKIEGLYAYATTSIIDESYTIYGTEDLVNVENPQLVYVILSEDKGTGTFQLGNDKDGLGYYTNSNGTFVYYTIPENTGGTVKITKKTEDRVAGTFSFTAQDPNTGERIEVEDGSFDVEIRD